MSGTDANPYLIIVASLVADLYGLEHELEPSPATQGEFGVPEELTLPCITYDALRRLKDNVLARKLFSSEFAEGCVVTKGMELTSFFGEINPWERHALMART